MLDQQIELLKQFIAICKSDSNLLHNPKLRFYKDYLLSLGATIPPPNKEEEKPTFTSSKAEAKAAHESESQMESDETFPPLDLDETGVISSDEDIPLPMGDINKEISDEDIEKSSEYRDLAMQAFNDGDFQSAVDNYSKAIELNPGSAILHAKRAAALVKLLKPLAAIRDCSKAIEINPDSAAPYKFRGRAYRLLGKWLEAYQDLVTACKLDYDDTANEWLKEVEPNAKKILEYNRSKQRHIEEKELRERQERVRLAQEANRRAAEEAASRMQDEEDFDFEGAGSGQPGSKFGFIHEIMNDPEIREAIQKDPSVITSLTEMMSNPSSIMKHLQNPVLMKIMAKISSKAGGMPGFAGGMPGFSFGSADSEDGQKGGDQEASTAPKKAPEPDLD